MKPNSIRKKRRRRKRRRRKRREKKNRESFHNFSLSPIAVRTRIVEGVCLKVRPSLKFRLRTDSVSLRNWLCVTMATNSRAFQLATLCVFYFVLPGIHSVPPQSRNQIAPQQSRNPVSHSDSQNVKYNRYYPLVQPQPHIAYQQQFVQRPPVSPARAQKPVKAAATGQKKATQVNKKQGVSPARKQAVKVVKKPVAAPTRGATKYREYILILFLPNTLIAFCIVYLFS